MEASSSGLALVVSVIKDNRVKQRSEWSFLMSDRCLWEAVSRGWVSHLQPGLAGEGSPACHGEASGLSQPHGGDGQQQGCSAAIHRLCFPSGR